LLIVVEPKLRKEGRGCAGQAEAGRRMRPENAARECG
jgi:hypothetical protein